MELRKRRIRLYLVLFAVVWTLLVLRLFDLQLLEGEALAAAAISQYEVRVEGLDTRGTILDRNLEPLTGSTEQYYIFLQKSRESADSAALLEAVSARQIGGGGYSVYRTQLYDEGVIRALRDRCGAYVFRCPSRYSDSQLACHLIGYLNQAEQRGVSGLELACEDILQAGSGQLNLWADGGGNLLLAIPPKQEGGETLRESTVVTSLDSGLQRFCEEAAASSSGEDGFRGAVLVSDSSTGQILAWVSAPAFNPNAVADYLQKGDDCLVNKCLQGAYAPGSVFKVVVAAAALEAAEEAGEASGFFDSETVYVCSGREEVAGITLGCQSGPAGGHGEVNLERAMAVSCNCYFATLGQQLGYERIRDMALRMGLGSRVLDLFPEEHAGNLPAVEETGEWDISNLSIGQGSLLTTPLQIHRLMSIAACGGREIPLTVLMPEDGTQPDGTQLVSDWVLSSGTARKLESMLACVMTEGTGSGQGWDCPVYGKTGTAEAVRGGEKVNHCWFSGFCDAGGRRYVITVLAEDGVSGSASALPVFRSITDYLQVRSLTFS